MVRGEVFRLRVPRSTRGSEHRGARYAVVVQADELLALSTVIVAPTSRSAAPATFRPQVTIAGEQTRVMVEQLRTLAGERLVDRAGRLTPAEQLTVDEALELVLGL